MESCGLALPRAGPQQGEMSSMFGPYWLQSSPVEPFMRMLIFPREAGEICSQHLQESDTPWISGERQRCLLLGQTLLVPTEPGPRLWTRAAALPTASSRPLMKASLEPLQV